MLAPHHCPRCDFSLTHVPAAHSGACPECGLAFDDPDLVALERASPAMRVRRVALILGAAQLVWVIATLTESIALFQNWGSWPIHALRYQPDTLLALDGVRWTIWAILLTMLTWRPTDRGVIRRVSVVMATTLCWMAVGTVIWRTGEFVTWEFDPRRTSLLIVGVGFTLASLRTVFAHPSRRDGRFARLRAGAPWIVATASVTAGTLLAPSFHEAIRQSAALLAVIAVTLALAAWARRFWQPRFHLWLIALHAMTCVLAVASIAQAIVDRSPGHSFHDLGPAWLPASTWLPLARAVALAAAAFTIPIFVDVLSARCARTWTRLVPDQIAQHRRLIDQPDLTRLDRWALRALVSITLVAAFVLAMHRTDLIGLTSAPQAIPKAFFQFSLLGITLCLAILARPFIACRTPSAFVLAAAVWSSAGLTVAAWAEGVAPVRSGTTDLLTHPAVLVALGVLGTIGIRVLHVPSMTMPQIMARLLVAPVVVIATALLYGLSTTLSHDTLSRTLLGCVVLSGIALVIRRRLPLRLTAVIQARLIRGLSTWVIGACMALALGTSCVRFIERRPRISVSWSGDSSVRLIDSLSEDLPQYATIVLVGATLLLVLIAGFAARSRSRAIPAERTAPSIDR